MILYLYKYFLHVKDASLGLRYLSLPFIEHSLILLSIFLLDSVVSPTSNRYYVPHLTNFGFIVLLSKHRNVSFHSIVLLLEVGILAHYLILDCSCSHSIYSCFLDNWIVNFLRNLEALADVTTVFKNHINVVFH